MIWLFLLLFVGTAQAEGWSAAPTVKCVLDARGQCITGDGFNVGCYQKMQEAMKAAEKYHFWPYIDIADYDVVGESDYPKGCTEVCRRKMDYDAAVERKKKREAEFSSKKKWDATMKECVGKEQP